MPEEIYTYVIAGAGLAGASAVQGIRELDKKGSILLIGNENHLPYDRPPLTKKLWFGQKKVEEIFVHNQDYYDQNGAKLLLGRRVMALDARQRAVAVEHGPSFHYERLLLATGATPRPLPIPGGDLDGISYYRYLNDYLGIRKEASEGKSVAVIGGGFIGSEIAAALNVNKMEVTMIFSSTHLCSRVFPADLGKAMSSYYRKRGVKIMAGEKPISITRKRNRFSIQTASGKQIISDLVIAGIGVTPETKLAEGAGLKSGNGIVVSEYLQTSDPNIYAAGDNAFFPYQVLGQQMRIEHWDNAVNQGKLAGRNMAGAHESYTYMPYFFSDLFEFGYEAVGDVNSRLETYADWKKENDTGVIYYLKDQKVRGVMMCNIWEKVEAARELIRKVEGMTPKNLQGLIY